jgi:uncharacterized protein
MLSFDIRSLDDQAATVSGALDAADPAWLDDDMRPETAVLATGRLSGAGPGRYYWSGAIAGTATVPCRRCLVDTTVHVAENVHVLFAEAGDEIEDPEVYPLERHARSIDLRPAVREQWLLAVPRFPVCSDDCKGLCPTCGAELNAGPCSCSTVVDVRWAALRSDRGENAES